MVTGRKAERWTRSSVSAEREALERIIAALASVDGRDACLVYLLGQVGSEDDSGDATATPLRRYLSVVLALQHHARHGGLTPAQINRLVSIGSAILKTQGIDASVSKLGFMLGDLHAAMAQVHDKDGRLWDAAWSQELGGFFASRDDSPERAAQGAIASAERALRLGHARIADGSYRRAEELAPAGADWERARLGRISAARLSGDLDEAQRLLTEAESRGPALGDETRAALSWQRLCIDAGRTGNLAAMVAAVGPGKPHRNLACLLRASQWASAFATRQWAEQLPRAESIRRAMPDGVPRGDPLWFQYNFVVQLERCDDTETPLGMRLEALGGVLSALKRMPNVEDELLAWLGSARWLARLNQSTRALLAFAEYQSLSLKLTAGATSDALGVAADMVAAARHGADAFGAPSKRAGAQLRRIDVSLPARAASLSKLAVGAAGVMVKSTFSGIGKTLEERRAMQRAQFAELAEMLAAGFGRLKGPLMKAAQLAGYFELGLDQTTKKAFAGLLSESPTFASDVIRETVEKELGRPIEELFAHWSPEPLAAASIAQVHRARLHSGREVVVKVQYPGVEASIRADMRAVRFFGPVIKRMFPHADPQPLLSAFERQIMGECDFEQEAANQAAFARQVAALPDMMVPEVVREMSTRRVLTMDYVDGAKFDDFLRHSTQAERNRAGVAIFTQLFTALFETGFLHGDPHPGNMLFTDDKVCMLDFGVVDQVHDEVATVWRSVVRGMLKGDDLSIDWTLFGFDLTTGDFDPAAQCDIIRSTFARPWLEDRPFRYDGIYMKEKLRVGALENANMRASTLPPAHAGYVKAILAVDSILCTLEAEANWHRIIWRIAFGEEVTQLAAGT